MRQFFSFVVLGSLHDASYLLVLLYLDISDFVRLDDDGDEIYFNIARM